MSSLTPNLSEVLAVQAYIEGIVRQIMGANPPLVSTRSDITTIDVGRITITVANTSTTATGSFPHNLGKMPKAVFCQSATAPFGSYVGSFVEIVSFTPSLFSIEVYNQNSYSGGVGVTVDYVAFG